MAQTVTIHDPATDSTFQATRHQWERLHRPAGRVLVADEDGNPTRQKAKPTSTSKPVEQEK